MNFVLRVTLFLFLFLVFSQQQAQAFAYIFAGGTRSPDIVTHPIGYTGTGGTLTVTVGIDPTSVNSVAMQVSVQNVVNTFNGLQATTGNLAFPLGFNEVDFESVLLHEVGHSLGLAHVNAATESGLVGDERNFTKADAGADGVFDLDDGADNVIGSADDLRDDDVNLNYFKKDDNNPFVLANVVDSTTYSRDLADLPVGDNFSANGDRAVGALLGFANTESVMQQGSFGSETQRTLVADDVAGIRYAESGLDELAGTADDYDLVLNYVGLDAGADILIDFDNNQTGFAVSQSFATSITSDHWRITSNQIFFNTNFNWVFNQTSNLNAVPEPTSAALSLFGLLMLTRHRRRRPGTRKN